MLVEAGGQAFLFAGKLVVANRSGVTQQNATNRNANASHR
jgi:hypothetical protein